MTSTSMILQVHQTAHGEIYCGCGECATADTLRRSPSTADHVFGRFDVERARFEVRRDLGTGDALLMGWHIPPRNP